MRTVEQVDGAQLEVELEMAGDREHFESARRWWGHVKLHHVDTLLAVG